MFDLLSLILGAARFAGVIWIADRFVIAVIKSAFVLFVNDIETRETRSLGPVFLGRGGFHLVVKTRKDLTEDSPLSVGWRKRLRRWRGVFGENRATKEKEDAEDRSGFHRPNSDNTDFIVSRLAIKFCFSPLEQ